VDTHRFRYAIDAKRLAVADVAVPQRKGVSGLPAKPLSRILGVEPGLSGKPAAAKQTPDRRGADGVVVQLALTDERVQNQRDRSRGMVAADVANELAHLVSQGARVAAVGAHFGSKRLEPAVFIGVVPPLECRGAKASTYVGAGRAKSLLAELV
jgi:hypothetical protein